MDKTKLKSQFKIQRIYVKESSCKVPYAPNFFIEKDFEKNEWKPNFSLETNVKHQILTNNQHEIVLHINASAKTEENKTAFTIDIQQAGIFIIENFSPEQIEQIVKAHAPALLYPYLCRAVSDASIHAGFPPLILAPLSFESRTAEQDATVNKNQEKKLEEIANKHIHPTILEESPTSIN